MSKNTDTTKPVRPLFSARSMAAGRKGALPTGASHSSAASSSFSASAGGAASSSSAPAGDGKTAGLTYVGPGHVSRVGDGGENSVGGRAGGSSSLSTHSASSAGTGIAKYEATINALSAGQGKFLVVGDGIMGPFMALCLRVHGIDCDLAQHSSVSDLDRGTICLTPSVTQMLGDVLSVSVPSGSVVGRILTFDHVGNDMCDIDLNEFREKGESPTFFCCDRPKIEKSLMSLCRVGANACNVMNKPEFGKGSLEALPEGGVRVSFNSGIQQDYLGIISTARNQELVPELTVTNEELQQRQENAESIREAMVKAPRWMEVCVPPLPELGRLEKRFTPGSQEIVEILTPRGTKMTVRPTMLATKLFYNVHMSIPDGASDPRAKTCSMKQFWDDVADHWTGGQPGYVSHTMFRAMFTHVQEHFNRTSALVYRTPIYNVPHWQEGNGRIFKIGHSAHSSAFDAIDCGDAQGFTDCFGLARSLANIRSTDIDKWVADRRLQVTEELDFHTQLQRYSMTELGQLGYMQSRFMMKMMGRYKKSWRGILRNYITLVGR